VHLVVVQQQRQVLACLRRLPRHLVVTPLPRHLALFLRPVWQLLPLVHLVARALVAHPPHQRRQSPLHLGVASKTAAHLELPHPLLHLRLGHPQVWLVLLQVLQQQLLRLVPPSPRLLHRLLLVQYQRRLGEGGLGVVRLQHLAASPRLVEAVAPVRHLAPCLLRADLRRAGDEGVASGRPSWT